MKNIIGDRIKDTVVLSYRTYHDIDVMFDNGYVAKNVQYMHFKRYEIKNRLKKNVFGVGFLGGNNINANAYICWHSIIQRCYDPKRLSIRPDYLGCSVAEKWHDFQNFQKFYIENFKEGFQIDKDLIVIGNRIYSEDTCSFIPREINVLFSKNKSRGTSIDNRGKKKYKARIFIDGKRVHLGMFCSEQEAFESFKKAKEKKIKEFAEKYKNVIDERVYNNLINFSL